MGQLNTITDKFNLDDAKSIIVYFLCKAMIKYIALQIGNMKKSQDFIVYPFEDGQTHIIIQSDKRIARINLDNGEGVLSRQNDIYPNFGKLSPMMNPISIKIDTNTIYKLLAIQPHKGDTIANGICIIG